MSERQTLRQRALATLVFLFVGLYAIFGCITAYRGDATGLSLASLERAGMVVVRGVFDSAKDW